MVKFKTHVKVNNGNAVMKTSKYYLNIVLVFGLAFIAMGKIQAQGKPQGKAGSRIEPKIFQAQEYKDTDTASSVVYFNMVASGEYGNQMRDMPMDKESAWAGAADLTLALKTQMKMFGDKFILGSRWILGYGIENQIPHFDNITGKISFGGQEKFVEGFKVDIMEAIAGYQINEIALASVEFGTAPMQGDPRFALQLPPGAISMMQRSLDMTLKATIAVIDNLWNEDYKKNHFSFGYIPLGGNGKKWLDYSEQNQLFIEFGTAKDKIDTRKDKQERNEERKRLISRDNGTFPDVFARMRLNEIGYKMQKVQNTRAYWSVTTRLGWVIGGYESPENQELMWTDNGMSFPKKVRKLTAETAVNGGMETERLGFDIAASTKVGAMICGYLVGDIYVNVGHHGRISAFGGVGAEKLGGVSGNSEFRTRNVSYTGGVKYSPYYGVIFCVTYYGTSTAPKSVTQIVDNMVLVHDGKGTVNGISAAFIWNLQNTIGKGN